MGFRTGIEPRFRQISKKMSAIIMDMQNLQRISPFFLDILGGIKKNVRQWN